MPHKKKHHHHSHSGRNSSRTRRGETPPGREKEEEEEHRMELIDKTVELRGSQILNMNTYHSIVCQRRFMAFATFMAWIAVILLVIALATCHWEVISFFNVEFKKVNVYLGVWGEWRIINDFKTLNERWIPHFPKPDDVERLAEADLKNYYLSQAFLSVVALILLLSTNMLAIYTFYHHRYMYKRVVACLYVVVAMTIYGTIEVLSSSIEEWNVDVLIKEKEMQLNFEVYRQVGYSTRLAQAAIGICAFAALCFGIGSHKQKGENAATAELEIEDREYHMGR